MLHAIWLGEITIRHRQVTIAHMDDPEIKGGEVPFRHHINKSTLKQQLRLHQRWKVPDAGTRQQRRRKSGIVVH